MNVLAQFGPYGQPWYEYPPVLFAVLLVLIVLGVAVRIYISVRRTRAAEHRINNGFPAKRRKW